MIYFAIITSDILFFIIFNTVVCSGEKLFDSSTITLEISVISHTLIKEVLFSFVLSSNKITSSVFSMAAFLASISKALTSVRPSLKDKAFPERKSLLVLYCFKKVFVSVPIRESIESIIDFVKIIEAAVN